MDIRDKETYFVVAFVVLFSIPAGLLWFRNHPQNIKNFTIRTLNDFNAVYIHEGAYVLLIKRRPEHTHVLLGPTEIGNIVRFTRTCISCDGPCNFNETVSLNLSDKCTLHIPHFTMCTVPKSCYWYDFKFNCDDLVSISKLVTTWYCICVVLVRACVLNIEVWVVVGPAK